MKRKPRILNSRYIESTARPCSNKPPKSARPPKNWSKPCWQTPFSTNSTRQAGCCACRKNSPPQRLEAACQRAIDYNDLSYKTVKRILAKNLEQQPAPIPVELPPARTFARPPAELVGALAEVFAWN
jgi:hypothetical protein